jgi:dihydroorotate dehydrogenase
VSDIYDTATALMRCLPPETAHGLALGALANGLGPRRAPLDDARLKSTFCGRTIPVPVGVSAGFDKNAIAIGGVFRLGTGFVEVGGVTPKPQAGNPKPRLFRLSADRAAINRMGFNNDGLDAVAQRLAAWRRKPSCDLPVGVNLAANGDSAEPATDFEALVARLAPLADFLTVDISCPNSANGQVFLDPDRLRDLLARLNAVRAAASGASARMLVKLAPDTDTVTLDTLLDIILAAKVDGITVANTTVARPDTLISAEKTERGGLSGRPLFAPSTEMLRHVYRQTGGTVPLIGVGGIGSGADAYAKVRAGASLLQLYTALIYEGPGLIRRICRDLSALLARDGFTSVAEAVGADHG